MFIPHPNNDNRTAPDDEISRYLLIDRTDLCRADIGLVFGNRHCFEPLAERAANLYGRHYFSKIIVSGGRPDIHGRTEADILRNLLLDHGIPEDAIMAESASTNTKENVLFSRLSLSLNENSMSPPHKNVICIGTKVAGRRFLMTMKKHWPEAFAMASNVTPPDIRLENWPCHKETRNIVQQEFRKAVSYAAKGDITEVDIAKINEGAKMRGSKLLQLIPERP